MEVLEFIRVVKMRRGRVLPAEFKLREGENGLSVFALVDNPAPSEIIEAVQAVGKRGDLGAAVISVVLLRDLSLTLVRTPGGTLSAAVNAIHYEAKLSFFRRVSLWLRGIRVFEYFNSRISDKLCASARLMD